MSFCTALYTSAEGQPYVLRLPVYQFHMPVLVDDDGVVALLRDDFMGGAQEAASAVDSFLCNIITFRTLCVEQFGG